MKTIKIKFTDFWPDFIDNNNFIFNILSEQFNIDISDEPDYVFYSSFGHEHLKYNCIRVFFTGENQTPDFNICDYAMGFHNIIFDDRYMRLPLYFLYDDDLKLASKKHIISQQEIDSKDKFCNFVYSNSNAHPFREEFFHALNKYKLIHSGGRHLNNIGGRVENKFDFQKTSKFTIAFENTSTPGYSTEKIIQAFSAKTIPIYWGNPNIADEFNPKSFINCHLYNSTEDIIKTIQEIDNNDSLYKEMLEEPIHTQHADLHSHIGQITAEFLYNITKKGKLAYKRDIHSWGKNYELFLKKAIITSTQSKNRSFLQRLKSPFIK